MLKAVKLLSSFRFSANLVLVGLGSRLRLLRGNQVTASFQQHIQIKQRSRNDKLEIPAQQSPVIQDILSRATELSVTSHEDYCDKYLLMSQLCVAAGAVHGSSPWGGLTYGLRQESIPKKRGQFLFTGLLVQVTHASPRSEFGPSALDRTWSCDTCTLVVLKAVLFIGRIITEALAPGSPKLLNIYFEGIQELLPRTAIRILCVKCCSSDRRQNNKTKDCITQRAFQRRSFLFYSHLVALRCDG